jgi:chemotaxis protein methyltransferase CheR
MGLHFPRERWRDMERGIAAASRESGYAETEAFSHWLLSAPLTRPRIEGLASHLTVGETYFFRERESLDVLEQQLLPELLRARGRSERHLRIWSAGCCTGEEPYSIAMMIDRLIPDSENRNLTILATDINTHALRKAARGVFGAWSFRDTPGWLKERYFTRRQDGRFEIQPRLRRMVSFSYLNLAEDTYPSLVNGTNAMDVILCRNAVFHRGPLHQSSVTARLPARRRMADHQPGGNFDCAVSKVRGCKLPEAVSKAARVVMRATRPRCPGAIAAGERCLNGCAIGQILPARAPGG